MPIYIELASLIVNKKAVESKYQGGIDQFRKDCTEESIKSSEDIHLFGLARMNADEFDLDPLINGGLHWNKKTQTSNDFVLVNRYGGINWSTDWLEGDAIFVYHTSCLDFTKARAHYLANDITMDKLQEIVEWDDNLMCTFSI